LEGRAGPEYLGLGPFSLLFLMQHRQSLERSDASVNAINSPRRMISK